MIKKYITTIILSSLILLSGCTSNLNKTAFNINKNTPSSNIKGPMWKLENTNNTIYLYGTIHNASKDIYPLHKDVENAFDESDIFVMEQNFSDPSLDKQLLNTLLYYKDDDTMENHLSKEALDIVKKYSSLIKGGYEESIKLKPFAYARSMEDILSANRNFDSNFGVDKYFLQKSQISNKEILSLDDSIELYKDLGNLSDQCANKIILNLNNITDNSGLASFEMWKNSDIEKLKLDIDTSLQEYNQIVLINRNKKWVEKIINYIDDDKNYFIAVGFAHFVGEESIIALLNEKGITVSFLSN